MNKAELISEVAAKAGLSKKDSEKAVNAALIRGCSPHADSPCVI